MAVTYNKLWKILIDKKMSRADLGKAAEIAPNILTKMHRDEPVHLNIIGRILGKKGILLNISYMEIIDKIMTYEKILRNICCILKRELITDWRRFIFPMEVMKYYMSYTK